jgi:NADPH-dependent glutamate synthase beta subunit-like oxidoreductase/NAD(P)H-flavin reductase
MTQRTLPAQASPAPSKPLQLGYPGFSFVDLHRAERLADLHALFLQEMAAADAGLAARWQKHSDGSERQSGPAESTLLIEVGRHQSRFLARLFRVEEHAQARREHLQQRQIVYRFRDRFVKKNVRAAEVEGLDAASVRARAQSLLEKLPGIDGIAEDEEERYAAKVWNLLERASPAEAAPAGTSFFCATKGADGADAPAFAGSGETVAGALALLAQDFKLRRTAGDKALSQWRSLREAHTVDWENGLVHHERPDPKLPEAIESNPKHFRMRDGFKLTDDRGTLGQVLNQLDQCVFCHEREKDSCSRGLLDKKTKQVTKNPLGIDLNGCPLDERISEMHLLFAEGDPLAALSMIMIDNPMCPGTGHRICNDCMKACIYQKQEPVNIPQVETNVLTDVLRFPFGPEIYLFLTRWNALRAVRPYALPYNGINVLVVGMGPAGYTLSHYLAQEGFGVIGIDGLKVEPLPGSWTGRASSAPKEFPAIPFESWGQIKSELDERVLLGFGGVSEYGITVRWDKNFLTLPYLSLLRRENFELHGGTRFGGALELEDCWELGIDHIAIASGAGKPTIVEMKNNLSRGIRKASDFLMALQLTGAFKKDSMANLQIRLPVVVIGGGLTGIDTTTEALAYYPGQVEKLTQRFDELCGRFGEAVIRKLFNAEETEILNEFLGHGRAVIAERAKAGREQRDPDFVTLVRSWGGVKLVYRKSMEDSPAYRLNHEEVTKALEEGITFIECMSPTEALLDQYGAVRGIVFERQNQDENGKWRASGEMVEMAARSILVAAGTSPNTMYERERPGTFQLDEKQSFFQVYRQENGQRVPVKRGKDAGGTGFLTSFDDGRHTVSVYGDNHPAYAGNVVKAMASARHGYEHVRKLYEERIAKLSHSAQDIASRRTQWRELTQKLDFELRCTVREVNRLTSTITEVVVHAPAAARKFQPGQFYRLQNFEVNAPLAGDTRLCFEGLALTGAWTDPKRGLLSMIVLEMGVSSRLCAILKPGEEVVVMGPTGTPTEIPENERVILAGGGLGNAVLFSIGRALRKRGCEVVYFAAFRRGEDLFKREELESAADVVIWSTDSGAAIETNPARPYDRHFRGNVVQAMQAYAKGEFGATKIDLTGCERIICIGSDRMMNAVKAARFGVLKPHLKAGHIAIGSINSPMQCMMKEICAQCLCKHVDPETGVEIAPVFSCFNQDQPLDRVDFDNLMQRLRVNSVSEKISNLWLDHLVHREKLPLWTNL